MVRAAWPPRADGRSPSAEAQGMAAAYPARRSRHHPSRHGRRTHRRRRSPRPGTRAVRSVLRPCSAPRRAPPEGAVGDTVSRGPTEAARDGAVRTGFLLHFRPREHDTQNCSTGVSAAVRRPVADGPARRPTPGSSSRRTSGSRRERWLEAIERERQLFVVERWSDDEGHARHCFVSVQVKAPVALASHWPSWNTPTTYVPVSGTV